MVLLMIKSDANSIAERQVFLHLKNHISYASPMVESDKFYLGFKISYKLYDITQRRSDDKERQVFFKIQGSLNSTGRRRL